MKIRYEDNDGKILECSGALISSHHLLTTTNCVSRCNGVTPLRVPFDRRRLSIYAGDNCERPGLCLRDYRVSRIFLHPLANHCQSDGIAILVLGNNAKGLEAWPVCMPTRHLKITKHLLTAGIGSVPESRTALPSRGLRVMVLRFLKDDRRTGLIKTRGRLGSSFCIRDNGGPLFQFEDDRHALIGAFIGKDPFCDNGDINNELTFVDIRSQLDWICSVTGICPLPTGNQPKARRRLFVPALS